jgi:UDP-N-acetylglucosamine 3-dehydrogenase
MHKHKGDVLRTAVIGCGLFGEKHACVLNDLPNADLVAVCDKNENVASTLAQKLGCSAYGNIESMLAKENIDAVTIAVSEDYHLSVAEFVARAKKHILIEKPIAKNYEEAQKIERLAKENGIRLMVGHILKWEGRFQYTAEAIKRGELGDIISIYLKRSTTNGTPRRLKGSVSIFHYMGVHDIEAMLTFAEPAKPIKVYVQGVSKKNTPYNDIDTVFSTITFDNGVVGCLQLCWALPDGGSCDFVIQGEVLGTKAVSYITMQNQGLAIYRENSPVEYPELTYQPEYYGHIHGKLYEEVSHFVTNTLNGEAYAVSTDRAILAVRTIDACFKSLKSGMPVEIS